MAYVKQLIQTAPFPQDIKNQLLQKADSFSPEKIFEVEEACWALISQQFQNDLRAKIQDAVFGAQNENGGKTYTKEDFKKMEDDMFSQLVQKLEASNSEEKIAEIKEKLATHSQNQPSQNPV
ncbi:MAG: hypothetical protein ABH816_01300 [Candidatus Levyibacteriota bacterium]